MALNVFVVFLICLLGVHVHGQATLTATTSTACTHGTPTIPITTDVTLTCTATTATITAILAGDAANSQPNAAMVFKQNGNVVFTLDAAAADAAGITETGTTYTETSAASGTKGLAVTISSVPADVHSGGTWTCEVTAGGDAGTAVAAEASANTLNLATFCTDFTGNGFCGAGAPTITCGTGSLQLDAWETDTTAALSIKKGVTEKFKISATNIAAAATSGNLEVGTGTWSASAATATTIVTAPTIGTGDIDSTSDWICEITGATGSYNGISATFAYPASSCATFTIAQATCATATSVPSITCTTGTYQLDAWELDNTAVLNVRKDGVVKYSLGASDISAGATSGTTLTSGTGSWSATSAAATAVTIAPTTVATADLGTGWTCDITVATGSFTGGSASMTLSSCSGAEMNKVAGFLLALLVAIKMMLF